MKKTYILFTFLSLVILSCGISPLPIDYNHDECAYCKMKIADARFGAELVTSKGKVFKFDSAECLIWSYINDENTEYAYLLVTDYSKPHQFINAQEATFLISENLPSPMGGNLSSFEQIDVANYMRKEKGGDLLMWNQLTEKYRDLYL